MGLNLTWQDKDKLQHGHCATDLDTIVRFTLPEPCDEKELAGVILLPGMKMYYVLNDPRIYPVSELSRPLGKKAHAIKYIQGYTRLSEDQVKARLRQNLASMLPTSMLAQERERCIESMVDDYLKPGSIHSIGTSFVAGMMIQNDKATVPVQIFVRYVSKEEFDAKAQLAREKNDGKTAWVTDRWEGISRLQRNEKCQECPLSTYLGVMENPVLERLKKQLSRKDETGKRRVLQGIYKQLMKTHKGKQAQGEYRRLLDGKNEYLPQLLSYLAETMRKIPLLEHQARNFTHKYFHDFDSNDKGCHRGSSYSHFGTYFEFLARFGTFHLLNGGYLHTDATVPVEELAALQKELFKARMILESEKIPAMNVYDRQGKLMYQAPHATGGLSGNPNQGYGVGIEGRQEAITVVCQAPNIFDLPVEQRRKIIADEGLEGIMAVGAQMHEGMPRFYFQEIVREGKTFFGITASGERQELPSISESREDGYVFTPFGGFFDSENIGRIEYTTTSPYDGFSYLQRLLEKQVQIARKYGIPIEGC